MAVYAWGHVDAKTVQPRTLQVEQSFACIDFAMGAVGPVRSVVEATTPGGRERLFQCEQFSLWRLSGQLPFRVGAVGVPRVLACIEGVGKVEHGGVEYVVEKSDVWLLPSMAGACTFRPSGAVCLLEIALLE